MRNHEPRSIPLTTRLRRPVHRALLTFVGITAAALGLVMSSTVGCRQTPEGARFAEGALFADRIYTMDPDRPVVEAVAWSRGRFVAVGSRREIERWVGEGTRRVDATGSTAFPGFVDAHAHLLGLGQGLDRLDLMGTRSYEEICRLVAEAASRAEPGSWILGRGWDQNDWENTDFPTHGALSRAAPDHPVLLTRVDGHAALANRRAMDEVGLDRATRDPEGGKLIRDTSGEPTGVLIDTAVGLVADRVPEATPAQIRRALEAAVAECHRNGLIGIHDAGIGRAVEDAYRDLIEEDRFDFRVYAMVSGSDREYLDQALARGPIAGLGDGRLSVRSVKLYADGALGSRGAALLAPYSDDPGERGLILTPREEILAVTRRCLEAGFQVGTHAIGDRGNRAVLDAYEEALSTHPNADARLRIEHAQVIAPEDIPRFASLGVVPSMQPTHCTSDMDWADERLGPERIRGAYAWRSLLDQGNRIPAGSDFPVERVDPLLGLYAAVTRQHADGTPLGGFLPEERMTREEAVRGFTVDAAWAAFEEDLRGTIATGMYADLSVFDLDLMTCPSPAILEANAVATIVGGRVVHDAIR